MCAGAGPAPRYVRFDDAVAGWGGIDWDDTYNGRSGSAIDPAQCGAGLWRPLRTLAYDRCGVALPSSVAEQPRPRVVLLGRNEFDKRHILNADSLVTELRAALPGVAVDRVVFQDLSPTEQLRELAATTVLVSTIGSASFRLVFLPDGAAMVSVGAPLVRPSLRCSCLTARTPFRRNYVPARAAMVSVGATPRSAVSHAHSMSATGQPIDP